MASHKNKIRKLLGSLLHLGEDLVRCMEMSIEPFLAFLREALRTQSAGGAPVRCAKLVLKAWEKILRSKRARASMPPSTPDAPPKSPMARSGCSGLEMAGKQRDAKPIAAMKERPSRIVGEHCAVCLLSAPRSQRFATCGGCGSYAYCCKQHAKEHWRNGHKEECVLLQQERVAEKHRKCFMGM